MVTAHSNVICSVSVQHVADQLIQDLPSPSVPLPTCTALQRELASLSAADSPSQQEPLPKRAKLDPQQLISSVVFSSVPVHRQVAVCNAVRAVVEGLPVQPGFWKLFLASDIDSTLFEFLFHVRHFIAGPVRIFL